MISFEWRDWISNLKNRRWPPFLQPLYKFLFRFKKHSGVEVTEEEWKYLIVLDACRYDYFRELNWLPGRLEKRISKGATTAEWLKKNFSGYFDDIVYISANPHVSDADLDSCINPNEHFHDHYLPFLEDGSEEMGVTRPEYVNESVKKALKEHPDKRIIIHYMQPHAPYIGDYRVGEGSLYELYKEGVPRDELVRAYKSNLKLVLSEIEEIMGDLNGRTVITGDHVEILGEKGVYAHGKGLYLKELVEVPWFVMEGDE